MLARAIWTGRSAGVGRRREQRLGERDAFVGLAGIGELAGEHQGNVAVFRQLSSGFAGDFSSFVVLLGFAVGIDFALIALRDEFAAELQHLVVGVDGLQGLVLLAVEDGEAIKEEGARILFRLGILAGGMLRLVDELLQDGSGFVVLAEGFVGERLVEADLGELQRLLGERLWPSSARRANAS